MMACRASDTPAAIASRLRGGARQRRGAIGLRPDDVGSPATESFGMRRGLAILFDIRLQNEAIRIARRFGLGNGLIRNRATRACRARGRRYAKKSGDERHSRRRIEAAQEQSACMPIP